MKHARVWRTDATFWGGAFGLFAALLADQILCATRLWTDGRDSVSGRHAASMKPPSAVPEDHPPDTEGYAVSK